MKIRIYRCPNCDNIYKPGVFQLLFAMRFRTMRFFKCPICKLRNWCKPEES